MTTFHDYESFIAFIEQDIPYNYRYKDGALAIEMVSDSTVYYDENGNVVCEYQDRNNSVASMYYTIKGNTVLPITVYTFEDLQAAEITTKFRGILFLPLYVAEVAAVIWLYFKKKEK